MIVGYSRNLRLLNKGTGKVIVQRDITFNGTDRDKNC